MHIRIAQKNDQVAWDRFVRQHPQGLAYHQFAWQQAINEVYNLKSYYLIAEENQTIAGVLPLILCRTLKFKYAYISLPFCDVGGVLVSTPLIKQRLFEQALLLARTNKTAGIEIRSQITAEGYPGVSNCKQKVRMVLELPASSEQLLANLKAKVRSQVRKPQRDGLFTHIGGMELIDDFYSIFAKNMHELGSPVHSRELFLAVLRNFGPQQARVAVTYLPNGVPAAAGIMLLHPTTVSNPWASSIKAYKRLNPNMLLYWSMLSYATDHGFPYFDFGRSTPGSGTHKFKQQWGAQAVPMEWKDIFHDRIIEASTTNSRLRSMVEKVWSRLPLSLTIFLGPLIRRHIPL